MNETRQNDRYQVQTVAPYADRICDWLDATLPKTGGEPWLDLPAIKQSTVRRVMRSATQLGDGEEIAVHIKLFRPARLSDRARDLLRGTRSVREFENLEEARKRGLPCVEPIAAGRFLDDAGNRSFLLTRTAPGVPLPRGTWTPGQAAAAGRLLRQAHDAGLHARDLHPGNILCADEDQLTLLDLTSAHFATPLEDQDRARSLAFFCRDLDGLVLDPQATPLLETYATPPATHDEAQRLARRLRSRALTAFGRRAFRPCHHTKVQVGRGRPRWFLHRPAEGDWEACRQLAKGLDDLRPTKSGRRGAVYLTENVAIKRRSAAATRRLLQSAYQLLFVDVPTAQPIAATTFRRQGLYFCHRLPYPDLQAEVQQGLDSGSLRVGAADLGRTVARLHAFGLRNRDLKFENLIRDPTTQRIVLVDLDGIRRNAPSDSRGQAADLGRLLAAWRAAGKPGGTRVWQAFLRSYIRTCKCLRHRLDLTPLLRRTEVRARAWASAHPNTLG